MTFSCYQLWLGSSIVEIATGVQAEQIHGVLCTPASVRTTHCSLCAEMQRGTTLHILTDFPTTFSGAGTAVCQVLWEQLRMGVAQRQQVLHDLLLVAKDRTDAVAP
jgi:hypothetical protein